MIHFFSFPTMGKEFRLNYGTTFSKGDTMPFSENFVSRLLSIYTGGRTVYVSEGQFPKQFQSFPLPQHTQVVGGYVSEETAHYSRAHLMLDSSLGPIGFRKALTDLLEEQGWKNIETYPYRPLFLDPRDVQHQPESVLSKEGWQLQMQIQDYKTPAGLTAIHLHLEKHIFDHHEQEGGLLEYLPQFQLNDLVFLQEHGGHWGADHAQYSGTLSSELEASQLLEHFTKQLHTKLWQDIECLKGKASAMCYCTYSSHESTYEVHLFISGWANTYLHKFHLEAYASGQNQGSSIVTFATH
jgi:hypothetical protein